MGRELLNIGVKMRKVAIFTIKRFSRSVYNHPFLVVMLCFLIFMYRTFPLFFSILVSASPVLICTAILLGTLLSYGEPNIPEIEIEEKTSHEVVSLKTNVLENATVVEQNESFYVDRFSEKRRDEVEHSNEQPSLSEVHKDDIAPLIEERSREIELENGEIMEGKRELDDMKYKQKGEWNEEMLSDGEVLENHYASIPRVDDDNIDSDDERSEADSFGSEKVNVDSLDSPPQSPWKRVEEREEQEQEEEEDEDDLDSGSDGAESSSPDASMADIMPMLDELHPLLDEEGAQLAHISANGSDVESKRSSKSSISSHESENENEDHEELEVAEDDNEDGEEGDKEDQTKSAITWTEEDQKNLMDLGSSEIERNQRLENLILRRRARKNMSMVPERNLIDLESFDIPFNIAPITTSRQNPFDMPHDNSGLPPIPGSAPSILLQRRNPFDIPYDSSEEKPDLAGGKLQEEFTTLPSRETFFRRHESFNVRPSVFAPMQDVKYRPFFVPERIDSDESTSYSPFQRQSSELSDSKVESLGSVEDLEDRNLVDKDSKPDSNVKEVTEVSSSVDPELIFKKEEVSEDVPKEPKLISERDHVFDVGHGSQSSEDEEPVENQVQATGNHSNSQAIEHRYSRDTSSSSLSEESERVYIETEEGSIILEERREVNAEEPQISIEAPAESSNLTVTSAVVDDVPHREPVYDSSLPDAESDLVLPPVLVKRTVSFVERESEGSSQEMDKDISDIVMLSELSSMLHPVNEHVSVPSESTVETSVEENLVDQEADDSIHASVNSSKYQNLGQSVEEKSTVEYSIEKEETIASSEIHAQSPIYDSDVYVAESYENLISTTPAEGNTVPFFYDKPMDEPTFKHLNEVKASDAAIESLQEVQTIQESHILEVQDLDHDILSNVNSPLSPDFNSTQSGIFEAASSHADVHTIVEEVDEIKEIDDGLLSELDSVGDFSIPQWGSSSNELEEHIDSVGESSSLVHHAETSTLRVVEVISVELNTIEHGSISENSREEEIDINVEDTESISEIHSSETCVAEHIDKSNKESNDIDGQDSPDQGTSEHETSSKKHEATNNSEIDTPSEMPELEAQTLEDIDLSFKQIGDKEIEKALVLETSNDELAIEEKVNEHSEDEKVDATSGVINLTHETPILEVRSTEEKQETSLESHDLKPDSLESTSVPLKHVLVKVEGDKVESSQDKELTIEEINVVAAEKTDHKVEESQDLRVIKSAKGKGKVSRSSSSSSSSSSESGSSDSDKE